MATGWSIMVKLEPLAMSGPSSGTVSGGAFRGTFCSGSVRCELICCSKYDRCSKT